jgi:hypothetical protein
MHYEEGTHIMDIMVYSREAANSLASIDLGLNLGVCFALSLTFSFFGGGVSLWSFTSESAAAASVQRF